MGKYIRCHIQSLEHEENNLGDIKLSQYINIKSYAGHWLQHFEESNTLTSVRLLVFLQMHQPRIIICRYSYLICITLIRDLYNYASSNEDIVNSIHSFVIHTEFYSNLNLQYEENPDTKES